MSSNTHNIVIVGGSFAGITTAHRLLRNVIPALPKDQRDSFKVIMISPSKEFFLVPAVLRALVEPNLIEKSNLLQDIEPAFAEYKVSGKPNSGLHFVQGFVVKVNEATRELEYKLSGATQGPATDKLSYDTLIIASGSTTSTPWFKPTAGPSSELRKELSKLAKSLKAAQTIAVGGGGTTGVELAAELGETYPNKTIILYTGSKGALPAMQERFGKETERRLREKLNVQVVTGVRVNETREIGRNQTELVLSNGTTKQVDVYVPTSGSMPNTQFLPSSWVDERGYALADGYLRLDNASRDDSGVFFVGDVLSSFGTIMDIKSQLAVLKLVLIQRLKSYAAGTPTDLTGIAKYETPNPDKKLFVITLGRNGGLGMLPNGWRVPSFVVKFVIAKDLLKNAVKFLAGNMI